MNPLNFNLYLHAVLDDSLAVLLDFVRWLVRYERIRLKWWTRLEDPTIEFRWLRCVLTCNRLVIRFVGIGLIIMPEARDRRERPVDYPAAFLNRRSHGILLDEPPAHLNPFQSPVQRLPPSESMGRGGFARGNLGVRRRGLGVARRGRARASASVLPSWYPRTPLRDVSSVVRVSYIIAREALL